MALLSGLTERLDVDTLRAEFPILQKPLPNGKRLVYLDTAATAQKPRAVIQKIVEVYEGYYANVHRGIHTLGGRVTTEMENSREIVRRFLNAKSSDEIVFTSGTTESINLVAEAWGRTTLSPGDEILLNLAEHHANFVPWQRVAEQTGAKLRFIPLTEDGRLDLSQLDDCLTSRTRILSVAGMSNVFGTMHPLRELLSAARRVNAVTMIDAAQSVPHASVDVQELDCDFLTFSGHKIYGPNGVGVLYAKMSLLESMDVYQTGGNMIRRVTPESSTWADLPARFEAGTPAIAEIIALGTAIEFLQQWSFDAIAAHEHDLTAYGMQRLSEIDGLRVLGPTLEHRGGILTFVVDGLSPQDLSELLDHKGVAVRAGHHCTMPLHQLLEIPASTRASFGIYNTREDVDALMSALQYAVKMLRQ